MYTPQCAARTSICFLFSRRRISLCNWDAQGSESDCCLIFCTTQGKPAATVETPSLGAGITAALNSGAVNLSASTSLVTEALWPGWKGLSLRAGEQEHPSSKGFLLPPTRRHCTVFNDALSIKTKECCHCVDVRNRNIHQGNRKKGNQRE